MPEMENTFDSDEQLSAIQVSVDGPEPTTLTEADYSEQGTGPYTYTATYNPASAGEYTWTLDTAEDAAGNDGASGQSQTIVVGETTLTLDDFNDGTLDTAYQGDRGAYQVTTNSPVLEGSHSLRMTDTSGSAFNLYATSGLSGLPQRGDTIQALVQSLNQNRTLGIYFLGTDASNAYFTQLEFSSGTLKLFKKSGGSFDTATTTSVSLSADTLYELEIQPASGGTLTVTVYEGTGSSRTELATVQRSDSEYTNPLIGFRGYEGATFDDVRVV